MKYLPISVVVLAVASIAGLVAFGSRRSPSGPPSAVFEPTTRRITADSSAGAARVTYRVINSGGEDLVIKSISTTCGCSVASVEPKVVGPGQASTITVLGTPPPAGTRAVEIRVATNDPRQPDAYLELILVGKGKTPYVANHSGPIRFGTVDGTAERQLFRISTRERAGERPWFGRAIGSPSSMNVEGGLVRERILGGGELAIRHYEYSVGLAELPEPGDFRFDLHLWPTSGGPLPAFTIEAIGAVPAPVIVTPKALYGSVAPGSDIRAFSVLFSADRSLPSLEIEPDEADGIAITRESPESGHVRFRIELPRGLDPPFSGTLVFRTNHPKAPIVEVPYLIGLTSE